jgi:regulator of RNase E activity RraA
MTHRAQFSGAVGTVVDGNFRDLEEHRKLGYPVSGNKDTMESNHRTI